MGAILEAHKARYVERQRGFGSKALVEAIERQNKPMVALPLYHGADPKWLVKYQDQFITPFGMALTVNSGQNFNLVQQLLGSTCRPNDIASGVDEPIVKTFRCSESMNSLIEPGLGSWLEHGPAPRLTAFLVAVSTKNTALVSLLVRQGADVHHPAEGRVKRTPLQLAAEVGYYPMVELLHNLGADVNEKPNRFGGATALQLASIGGFSKIVCYLISNGAKVAAPGATINGCTALEGAATHGRMDTVHILLKAGAADKGRDNAQISGAIHLAKENAHPDMASSLELYLKNGQLEHAAIPDLDLDDFLHDSVYS